MKTQIQLNGKKEISRFISLLSLGVCTALKEGAINVEEAAGYLFNPFTKATLKSLGIPAKVVDLIRLGAELGEVQSLVPLAMPQSIRHIENRAMNALSALPKTAPYDMRKWFTGLRRQSPSKSTTKRTSP